MINIQDAIANQEKELGRPLTEAEKKIIEGFAFALNGIWNNEQAKEAE